MVVILISLIALTWFSIWMLDTSFGLLSDVVAPICSIVGVFGLIVYSFLAYNYFAAEYRADIINREYGKDYSKMEIFYASDVIDTIRELHRERIEINGDLMTGE